MEEKVCPDCGLEYRSHVESCVDCGTELLGREEHARRLEETERCREAALVEPVVVRQNNLPRIDELYKALIAAGIPCQVHENPAMAGGGGCGGAIWSLVVSRADAEKAVQRIEDYQVELHPELGLARDLQSQGKCPACGSEVGPEAAECPDCGLTLLIVE